MLVLSRKKNESIVIGNETTIAVVDIRGDKVRLGIVAPQEVSVHRSEVWKAIHPGEQLPAPSTKQPAKVQGQRNPDGTLDDVPSERLMGDDR